jgi:hypothetical protein
MLAVPYCRRLLRKSVCAVGLVARTELNSTLKLRQLVLLGCVAQLVFCGRQQMVFTQDSALTVGALQQRGTHDCGKTSQDMGCVWRLKHLRNAGSDCVVSTVKVVGRLAFTLAQLLGAAFGNLWLTPELPNQSGSTGPGLRGSGHSR